MSKNFTLFESGALAAWKNDEVQLPNGRTVKGKHFIKDALNATGCEISTNALPPGASIPFHHAHKENEEIYIFLQGRGQMQIDDEIFDVREGSIVRVAPAALRIWRNTSADAHLICIVVQVRENSLRQYTAGDGVVSEKAVAWPA